MNPTPMIARAGTALCLAVTVAGCKVQHTVSLDEAKTITTEFVGRTVEAPPRSADDLLELVAAYDRPANTDDFVRLRRKAGTEPGSAIKNKPRRYAKFLAERSLARRHVGDMPGSLRDARQALRISDASNVGPGLDDFLRDIAWAEFIAGDFGRAVEIAERGLQRATHEMKHVNLSQLGRFALWRGEIDAAKRYFRRVEALRAGMTGQIHVYTGRERIAAAEGNWAKAERAARSFMSDLRANFSGDWVPAHISYAVIRQSRYLTEQGRLREAELVVRERLLHELERRGSSRAPIVADILGELSRVYLRAGRPDDAMALARTACDISDLLEFGWGSLLGGRVLCVKARAEGWLAQRRFAAARTLYDEIKTEFGRINPLGYANLLRDDPNRLLTEILTGPAEDTAAVIDDHLANLTERLGPKHYWSAEAKALKAANLARTGKPAAALPLFREAFSVMTQRSRRSAEADASLMRQRFVYLAEVYLDALAEALVRNRSSALIEEAFRVAAEARAQRVTAAMSAGISRAAIGDRELAELARREQDAQRQIESTYALLARASLRGASEATISNLRIQIDDLRSARAAIVEDLEARYPDYARLLNPSPPDRLAIQRALRPDEALLSFYFTEGRGLVFVVPKSGPVALVDADLSRRSLAARVEPLRAALEPDATTVGDIPAFDMDAAWSLYRDLLGPARQVLDGASHLAVVNHAAMGQLPLAVLPTGRVHPIPDDELLFAEYRKVPWLARRWSSTVVPSEAAFVAGRSITATPPARRELVAFGDPAFGSVRTESVEVAAAASYKTRGLRLRRRSAPATVSLRRAGLSDLPPLPDTRDEVEAIAVTLEANLDQDIFLGKNASEGRVKSTDLSDRRIVVFATHGLVPGDLDGLSQPALALAAPRFDPSGEDGLLTLSEILSLRLDADLVVLSACNTAAGDGAGADAISGLARGFLYAGTRSLLVSGWPVETSSARLLTTALFERQKKDRSTWAEALRRASLELIEARTYRLADGRSAFAYAHPLFWAPFFIVGNGGA